MPGARIIAHLDMDAFFASLEERERPRLAGLPLVVGADPEGGKGRGVVSTANYRARAYGIRSALPIRKAWEFSEKAKREGKPPAVFIEPNFRLYETVSRRVMEILRAHALCIEISSIDEAYIDLSFAHTYTEASHVAKKIKQAIVSHEHLTASVGIGPNKLIAKIASDREKPDGLTVVHPELVDAFLAPLPVRTIPGIGPKTETWLRMRGISTVGELIALPLHTLEKEIGKWGTELYHKARGIDDTPLAGSHEAKSIGEQETFHRDTKNPAELHAEAAKLASRVGARFAKSGFSSFQRIVLTVRFEDFETVTRSKTLARPEKNPSVLPFEAIKMLMPFLDSRENPKKKPIRLLGIRIEKFASHTRL